MLTLNTMPNQIGSRPMLLMIGRKIGMVRNMIPIQSMNAFLNRKIYSIPVPSLPMVGGNQRGPARTLHYSASSGYVAFSTDAATLEEYLRSSDTQGKSLRETAGLSETAQKVAGSGTSLFGY